LRLGTVKKYSNCDENKMKEHFPEGVIDKAYSECYTANNLVISI
jgi:hypothetical protein